mgnify:CR=1 FL=1
MGHARYQRGWIVYVPKLQRYITSRTIRCDERTMYKDINAVPPTVKAPAPDSDSDNDDTPAPAPAAAPAPAPAAAPPPRPVPPAHVPGQCATPWCTFRDNHSGGHSFEVHGPGKPSAHTRSSARASIAGVGPEPNYEAMEAAVTHETMEEAFKSKIIHEAGEQHHRTIPQSYEEAISGPDAVHWKSAMDVEMSDQESVPTWELVKASSIPKGRRIVGCTWAYDIKRNADGSIARWKSRLCAQGFSQMYGYDYHHTYSNTVSWSSVRLICSLAANKGMTITAVDIKTAFLNGMIEEEIYMKQPKGYIKYDGDEPLLCKLLRAIYGLKQSGRVWEHRLVKKLLEMAFIRCDIDPCLFTKDDKGEQIILAIFVDDIIIASTSDSLRADTIKELQTDFQLTDQGVLSWILGVRVTQAPSLVTLDQELYIGDMISALGPKFNDKKGRATPCNDQVLHLDTHDKTSECNPEYRKLLGKIGWLANTTRPDISFIISQMARFNLSNSELHMAVLEGICQYLGATKNWMLKYGKGCDADLRDLITSNSDFLAQAFDDMTPFAFTDTSYGGEKPMAGYGIAIGGGLIDWKGYRLPLTPTPPTSRQPRRWCASASTSISP